MEFANFDQFMKALDRLYKRSLRLNRQINRDRKDAARSGKGSGIPNTKQLLTQCKRLEKASEKLLKKVRADERRREVRKRTRSVSTSRRAPNAPEGAEYDGRSNALLR